MKIAVIIAEYNPFHNGHAEHVAFTKSAGFDAVAAIMSPNFMQRGDVACCSKWVRAEMALRGGVDLVIELPTPAAISAAENFAATGVSLAHALGCVSALSFGVESAVFEDFERAFVLTKSVEFNALVQKNLASGTSYPAALSTSAVDLQEWQVAEVLRNPNNTLGFEYFKANAAYAKPLEIVTHKRSGCHDEIISDDRGLGIVNASHIRKLMQENANFKRFVRGESFKILSDEIGKRNAPASIKNVENALLFKLRTMNENDFLNLPDVSEGLENRIVRAVKFAVDYDDLIGKIKTKRYTAARIRRILMAALLDVKQTDVAGKPRYIKVLGMNERGAEILKTVKSVAKLPIVTGYKDVQKLDDEAKAVFELECKATDVFGLATKTVRECGLEKSAKIVKI